MNSGRGIGSGPRRFWIGQRPAFNIHRPVVFLSRQTSRRPFTGLVTMPALSDPLFTRLSCQTYSYGYYRARSAISRRRSLFSLDRVEGCSSRVKKVSRICDTNTTTSVRNSRKRAVAVYPDVGFRFLLVRRGFPRSINVDVHVSNSFQRHSREQRGLFAQPSLCCSPVFFLSLS